MAVLLAVPFPLAVEGGAPATAAEVKIEAFRFSFDQENERYTYEDGRLVVEGLTVFASRVVVEPRQGTIRASGFVRLESSRISGTATAMIFNTETREALFQGARLYDASSGLFIEGEEVALLGEGRIRIRDCSFTTCGVDVPAPWSLSASELNLWPESVAVAENPALFIGPVPVFWFPIIAWPTVSQRRSGVLPPEISRESSSLKRLDLGFRLKVPVFLNLDVDHDLTLTPEVIENREGALGMEYNYAFRIGQLGKLAAFGLKEGEERDPNEENDILPPGEAALRDPRPGRFMVDWEHNQSVGEGTRLVLSYRHSSDGQVRREYQRVTEFRPYRTYQATLSDLAQFSDLTATVEQNADFLDESLYADHAGATDLGLRPQLLPRLSARLGGRLADGFPLSLELDLTAARFEADQEISGDFGLASPGLILPLSLGGAFELKLQVRRHLVEYRGLTQADGLGGETPLQEESYGQGEAGLELRTVFARVFSPSSGRYEALKHIFTPRLLFVAVEDVPQPLSDRVLRTRVAQRLAVLRFDNLLLGREQASGEGGAARELLRFNLIQRYNFLREADADPLAGPRLEGDQETEAGQPRLPLILEVNAAGATTSIASQLYYHHQLKRLTRTVFSLSGQAGPHAGLSVGYHFNEFTYLTPDNKLIPATNAFSFQGEVAFHERLSLGFDSRVNLQDAPPPLERRIDRAEVFLEYHPACYALRLSYQESVGTVRENGVETFFLDRQVKLTFNLTGLVGGRKAEAPTANRADETYPSQNPAARTTSAGSGAGHCRI